MSDISSVIPELIEIKWELNRGVIGQALVAVELFKVKYQVAQVQPVILCTKVDAALKWFCDQQGIIVWSPKE